MYKCKITKTSESTVYEGTPSSKNSARIAAAFIEQPNSRSIKVISGRLHGLQSESGSQQQLQAYRTVVTQKQGVLMCVIKLSQLSHLQN